MHPTMKKLLEAENPRYIDAAHCELNSDGTYRLRVLPAQTLMRCQLLLGPRETITASSWSVDVAEEIFVLSLSHEILPEMWETCKDRLSDNAKEDLVKLRILLNEEEEDVSYRSRKEPID